MQEDEALKKLLQQYDVEETSSTFNNHVMQRITVAANAKQSAPLLNAFTINLLKVIFLIVIIALVIIAIIFPVNNLRLPFAINISDGVYQQLFSFIIVFWIAMIVNLEINKRWAQ